MCIINSKNSDHSVQVKKKLPLLFLAKKGGGVQQSLKQSKY